MNKQATRYFELEHLIKAVEYYGMATEEPVKVTVCELWTQGFGVVRGVALRNPKDVINVPLARSIAFGRALKTLEQLKEMRDRLSPKLQESLTKRRDAEVNCRWVYKEGVGSRTAMETLNLTEEEMRDKYRR